MGSVIAAHSLWSAGSVVVAYGPSYSVAFEIFLDQTLSPTVAGRFIPIHYATREVLPIPFCHGFSIHEFSFYLLAVYIAHGYILIEKHKSKIVKAVFIYV